MSTVQAGLRYSVEHEWVNAESPVAVGVSQVAADALGEVVYVDLPRWAPSSPPARCAARSSRPSR